MAQSAAGLKRPARAAIALGALIISLYNAVMSPARPQRYRVLTAFASLALLLRIVIPVGFMPSGISGGWYLELCPDGMPEHVMVALYGEHHAHHGAASDNLFFECDYGNGAAGAFAFGCGHNNSFIVPLAGLLSSFDSIQHPTARLSGFQSRAPPAVVRYPANLT
jgi:hypothetical protein